MNACLAVAPDQLARIVDGNDQRDERIRALKPGDRGTGHREITDVILCHGAQEGTACVEYPNRQQHEKGRTFENAAYIEASQTEESLPGAAGDRLHALQRLARSRCSNFSGGRGLAPPRVIGRFEAEHKIREDKQGGGEAQPDQAVFEQNSP